MSEVSPAPEHQKNTGNEEFGPWNPGIQSQLPRHLKQYVTLFSPKNIFESLEEVEEISAFTGLRNEEVATFRPERLVTHELLIRIAANYSVSDGNQYQDLGINFRKIAQTILDKYLRTELKAAQNLYARTRQEVMQLVMENLQLLTPSPAAVSPNKKTKSTWYQRLLGSKSSTAQAVETQPDPGTQVSIWQKMSADAEAGSVEQAVYGSLAKVLGAVLVQHGRLLGDSDMLAKIVCNRVCNQYASIIIGKTFSPLIRQSAAKEGFDLLPNQEQPVIINVKGSSAAGKSTLRPLQQKLTRRLGLEWKEFALISPGYFP